MNSKKDLIILSKMEEMNYEFCFKNGISYYRNRNNYFCYNSDTYKNIPDCR